MQNFSLKITQPYKLRLISNKIFTTLLLSLLAIGVPCFGQNNLDSLLQLLTLEQDPTRRCQTLFDIAYQMEERDIQQAIDYGHQTLACAETSDQQEQIGKAYNLLGFYYRKTGNKVLCLEYYQKSVQIFENIGNEERLAKGWNNLGMVYKANLQYKKAIEYFLKTTDLQLKNEELKSNLYKSYYNISLTYKHLADSQNSLKYLQLAFAEQQRLNIPIDIIACNVAGKIHADLGQYDKAVDYFERTTSMTSNPSRSSEVYNHALAFIELGHIWILKNQLEKATLSLNKVEKIFNSQDFRIEGKQLFSLCSFQLETAKGNHQKASAHFKEYTIYDDSLFNQKNREITQKLEIAFELERKEKEVQLLENKSKIQQFRQYILAGIIAIISLLGIGLIYLYQQSRRQNLLLQEDLKNKQLIERQAEELQKVDALKSRLFTNIAHELRTPLTLISGPIENLLKDDSLATANKEVLNGILFNSEHLMKMSAQILELSKPEMLPIALELRQFSLPNFVQYLHSKFRLLAVSRNIELVGFDIEEEVDMVTDAKKLETILSNLLSNAIKYTDIDGQVQLTINAVADQIRFDLKDTGRGISKADLPYIFDRFFQAKHDKIVAEGGIGIGLSICKEYVQLLDGQIRVKSQVGEGSVFTVQLPQRLTTTESSLIEPLEFVPLAAVSTLPTKQFTEEPLLLESDYILIVEDNLELCTYLDSLLQSEYNLLFVHNGKEALKQIEDKCPALLITDLMMPVMDGIELVKSIRANSSWEALPILVLTARAGILDELKAVRVGVDDYLTKPFQEIELKTILYNLLNLAEEQRDGRAVARDFLMDTELQLADDLAEGTSEIDINWLRQLEQTMTDMSQEIDLTVEKIATRLAISSSHLTRKLKLLTGLTPKKYLNEVRMLQARRMIETGEYTSVKAVAYSVGFNSEKVFSRNFKARFGKTPSEYLKQV